MSDHLASSELKPPFCIPKRMQYFTVAKYFVVVGGLVYFSIHAEVDKLRVMLTQGDKAVSRSVRSQRKECHA